MRPVDTLQVATLRYFVFRKMDGFLLRVCVLSFDGSPTIEQLVWRKVKEIQCGGT